MSDNRAARRAATVRVVPADPGRPTGLARLQRALAAMAGVVLAMTIAAIVALAIITPMYPSRAAFDADPMRLIIAVFPTPGIAITLLLVIALITVTAMKRSRAQR